MKTGSIGRRAALSAMLALLAASGGAAAVELGTKPLRIVVPFAAGGTADVLARVRAR